MEILYLQAYKNYGRIILKRWRYVDGILGGVIYLVSDSSNYVTGTELIIDDGWLNKGLYKFYH